MAEFNSDKKSRRRLLSVIVISAIAFVIIVLPAVGINTYFSSASDDNSVYSDNVLVTCIVSGNDLVVQIFESEMANKVVSIEVIIDEYYIPPGLSIKMIPQGDKYPKKIVYKDILFGTNNDVLISVIARYDDGKSENIWLSDLRVT